MLHILWLIIKWTGTALLLLLGVIILTAVLVLFCPLRYRARAEKTAEAWKCSGGAGWLFGLVRVTVVRGSAGSYTQIRLFGAKSSTWKKLFSRKKRPMRKKKPEDRQSAAQEPRKRLQPEEKKSGEGKGLDAPRLPAGERNEQRKLLESRGEESRRKGNPLKGLFRRIADLYRRICDTVRKIISAVRNFWGKISLWKGFLEEPQTKAAFSLTWERVFAFLRHAGPQRWKGNIELGLGDPALTGQALAVLGATYPIHRGFLSVSPVWDRKVLEGNVSVKGRIYGVALLYMVCRLYFDKNVKGTLQWIIGQAS